MAKKIVFTEINTAKLLDAELVEETHSPADCEEVYRRLVNDRNFPVFVQFDWRKL